MDETRREGIAVVLGAGTMGRGIAADIADAGWTVHLWDVTTATAAEAKERLLKNHPPLLFRDAFAARILPGSLENDLDKLADADWVVEAVAESLPVKQAVLARVDRHCGPSTIVTSNTSGLSLNAMAADCSPDFRRRFFGTHFLNPPRYLKLLEVIPTAESTPAVVAGFTRFAEQILGHRVVLARDTPGFISTRLWITHLLDTIHTALETGVDIETVDTLTGPLIGRPRSATFRMADVVGLDVIAAVAANQYAALPNDPLRERLKIPAVMQSLLGSGRLGEKSGAGFYRRDGKAILTLDPATMTYRARREPALPEIADLSSFPLCERFAALKSRQTTDAIRFLDRILTRLIDYATNVGPEIAEDVLAIDCTMQWGFGWEIGPFAMADCRGASGTALYYTGPPSARTYKTFARGYHAWPNEPEYIDLVALKSSGRTLDDSSVASLIDLGDDIWCLEFHTKMNTLQPASCDFIQTSVAHAAREARGLVIANQGPHFSAGYDLSRLAKHIEQGDLAAIDAEMNACQQAFLALKYAPIPIIAAPHGFTLGGGCECVLHCHTIQAAPELSIGLPEARVGLIPCGGGTKEVLLRTLAAMGPGADLLEAARLTLLRLAVPKQSANAYEAREDDWLLDRDGISRNADRRLFEAKEYARNWDAAVPLLSTGATIPIVGKEGLAALRDDIARLRMEESLTDYDVRIADTFALLLSGGEDAPMGALPEQAHLDLERRLFLKLCREPQTLDRIRHLLTTGKHLRN